VHGLYIEGGRFDLAANQLARSHPKILVEELAILAPILFFWLHPGEGTGGISRDDFIDSVAAGILKKLPPAFETWRIRKQIQMSLSPTGVVLLQELDRFNLLVVRIKKTLELLRKVTNSI